MRGAADSRLVEAAAAAAEEHLAQGRDRRREAKLIVDDGEAALKLRELRELLRLCVGARRRDDDVLAASEAEGRKLLAPKGRAGDEDVPKVVRRVDRLWRQAHQRC